LLPRIDAHFRNVTVVGYQAVSSREKPLFRRAENQLIILGHSVTSASDQLMSAYRFQQQAHPELYGKADDLLYVRRCVVAVDIVTRALGEVEEKSASTNSQRLIEEVNEGLHKYLDRTIDSCLGSLHFDSEGAELGNNQIMLYRAGIPFSYPQQLNSNGAL